MDSHAQPHLEAPPLSVRERGRRYATIRVQLADEDIAGVIVTGTNLLYLSNGLPGEMLGFLPADPGADFTLVLSWRYLADISPQVLRDAQEWVTDIRSGRDAAPVAAAIKSLGLQERKIGFAGTLSHRAHAEILAALPTVELVDVSHIFDNVRTLKSDEELALIECANAIFDVAVDRVRDYAKIGMLGRNVVYEGQRLMRAAGGDPEGMFKFSFGPVGNQNPAIAELCLDRRICHGDIGTFTAHAHFRHYAGHSDQEIVFGKPSPLHVAMFAGVVAVRREVLARVRAGATHRELTDAYEEATAKVGFQTSPHSQMHLCGLESFEFPGPRFRIKDTKGGKGLGGSGNFQLAAGMVYSISPTLVYEKTGDAVLGGTSFVVTETGYHNFGSRSPELIVVP